MQVMVVCVRDSLSVILCIRPQRSGPTAGTIVWGTI